MATSIFDYLKPAIPISTGLLGALSFTVGTMAILQPLEASKQFGVTITDNDGAPVRHLNGWQKAWVRVTGVRNMSNGLINLTLTSWWQYEHFYGSPIVADTIKKCIGVSLLIGPIVSIGDALIIREYLREGPVGIQAKKTGQDASSGHMGVSIPIVAVAVACLLT